MGNLGVGARDYTTIYFLVSIPTYLYSQLPSSSSSQVPPVLIPFERMLLPCPPTYPTHQNPCTNGSRILAITNQRVTTFIDHYICKIIAVLLGYMGNHHHLEMGWCPMTTLAITLSVYLPICTKTHFHSPHTFTVSHSDFPSGAKSS